MVVVHIIPIYYQIKPCHGCPIYQPGFAHESNIKYLQNRAQNKVKQYLAWWWVLVLNDPAFLQMGNRKIFNIAVKKYSLD